MKAWAKAWRKLLDCMFPVNSIYCYPDYDIVSHGRALHFSHQQREGWPEVEEENIILSVCSQCIFVWLFHDNGHIVQAFAVFLFLVIPAGLWGHCSLCCVQGSSQSSAGAIALQAGINRAKNNPGERILSQREEIWLTHCAACLWCGAICFLWISMLMSLVVVIDLRGNVITERCGRQSYAWDNDQQRWTNKILVHSFM